MIMANRSLEDDSSGHALSVPKTNNKALAMAERLRTAMFSAITEEDVKEIITNQVAAAKKGDKAAIKFVFTYLMAPAPQAPKMAIAVQVNGARGKRRRGVSILNGEWTVEQIRAKVHQILDEEGGPISLLTLASRSGITAACIQKALIEDPEVYKGRGGFYRGRGGYQLTEDAG